MWGGFVKKFFSKSKDVRILTTKGNDIHFNLATEEWLFEKADLKQPTLFLWRNSPTIVIGRHQNPWKECRVEEMKQKQVKLARRKTGGGAVYQDLGNTCFSFLTPYEPNQNYDYRSINNEILISCFKRLGVNAQVSGRNDITVDGRKISGSAYRLHLGGKDGVGKKALHHGTVLFSVDFQALQTYLNPNKKKLESKGVESVVSRVLNLQTEFPNLNHQFFCNQLEKVFIEFYESCSIHQEVLELGKLEENQAIKQKYQRLSSWDWLYGECPYFKYTIEHKFDWGLIEITFEVKDGLIEQCRIYSDCLYPDFIEELNKKMIGVKYDSNGIHQLETTLKNFFSQNQLWIKMSQELSSWIRTQL